MKRLRVRMPGRWLLAALAAVAVAVTGTLLAPRTTAVWHWTASGTQLSEASIRLLETLQGPISLTVALPEGHPVRAHVRRLAASYERHTTVELEFVDPGRSQQRARELGLLRDGEGLVGWQGRHERFSTPSEARISRALQRMSRRSGRYVVWLTGHGERRPDRGTNFDMQAFAQALERRGYRPRSVHAKRVASIPDNTAVLVVAAPTRHLDTAARTLIDDYISRGGSVLWLTEPGGQAGTLLPVAVGDAPLEDPRTPELLDVDDTRLLVLDAEQGHPASRGVQAPLLLSRATSLTPGESEWQITPVITGSRRLTSDERPATLALALTRQLEDRRQHAAIVGDADFLADAYLGNGANLPFALNLVDWLGGNNALTGTFMRGAPDQRLDFRRTDVLLLGFGHIFALPILLALGAAWTWRRQRGGRASTG
ncbi:Gldg family protein [Arhodomonas sp. AD133]|uniref:Gldg family protein n=1 Tax=Arhodomonas sp. AD133 TaxID=3415009 RepID=UPI003EC10949